VIRSTIARVAAATLGALVAVAALVRSEPWQLTLLIGFDVFSLIYLAIVWAEIAGKDAARTQQLSQREDDSRATASLLVLVASTSAIVAEVLGLVKARETSGAMTVAITVSAVLSVVLAWGVVHTTYTLHYARLYYLGPPGGIDFNGKEQPDYFDFAYVAFTVGMTFQVSDTSISDRQVRKAILRQSLLAYLFGTVIIGTMINVMAGFIR
jgi:uncharacterized membrane protein